MRYSRIAEELEVQEALRFVAVDPVGNLAAVHILLYYVGTEDSILACQQIAALSQNSAGKR